MVLGVGERKNDGRDICVNLGGVASGDELCKRPQWLRWEPIVPRAQ